MRNSFTSHKASRVLPRLRDAGMIAASREKY